MNKNSVHEQKKDMHKTQQNEEDSNEENKYIYILISQTHTKFGAILRKFGRITYNHVAISLKADLMPLYAFARSQHNAPLLSRLVEETLTRYTLGEYNDVQVIIFKIKVSQEQYKCIQNKIQDIMKDDEYMYNYLSVLTFPMLKGFPQHKAFTCIEFVIYLLSEIGYEFEKPICSYTPDELIKILEKHEVFSGNLLDYISQKEFDGDYFAPFSYKILKDSVFEVKKIVIRAISHTHNFK